ncbi:DUF6612 family protein [Gracilibacillus kekensis]|uniref:Prolow-density lipoprotein receptor-related protein 1-like beta-propeller domain-containing protein n=1 Tax=Gracilibacillus kekensis TaxID=1027249 RepID=A0A1M7P292_9BACI|nr:DUF6612 family protein [Gracilibacillus kekensis]SHN10638.1 protein of unknown function [Gracilibacillus kekensis]
MRLKTFAFIIIFLLLTACENSLTQEEILDESVNNMTKLDSFAFTLSSEFTDGMDNITTLELEGETRMDPLEASIEVVQDIYEEEQESNTYYVDDMVYYKMGEEVEDLIKVELDETPSQLITAVQVFQSEQDKLEFEEEENEYVYTYTTSVNNTSFLESIYPDYLHSASFERIAMDFEYTDNIELHTAIKIDKETFLINELAIEYTGDYNVLNKDDPPTISEKIQFNFTKHNTIEEINLPEEDIQNAKTFMEFFGLDDVEIDENKLIEERNIEEEIKGNTSGNLMNEGRLATDGTWLYYSVSKKGLFRSKLDGNEREQLSESEVSSINIADDWLFFIDRTKGHLVYRMNKDGSGQRQVSGVYAEYLTVVNGWVYYIPNVNNPTGDTHILRSKTNLTNNDIIVDHSRQLIVANGYLIYKDYGQTLRVIDLLDDELRPDSLFANVEARNYAVSGDWLYYENVEDNYTIYRKNFKSRIEEKLVDQHSDSFNIAGDNVFYRNMDDDGRLYRYNITSDANQKISETAVHKLHVVENYLYFTLLENYEPEWYRMKLDGHYIEEADF